MLNIPAPETLVSLSLRIPEELHDEFLDFVQWHQASGIDHADRHMVGRASLEYVLQRLGGKKFQKWRKEQLTLRAHQAELERQAEQERQEAQQAPAGAEANKALSSAGVADDDAAAKRARLEQVKSKLTQTDAA